MFPTAFAKQPKKECSQFDLPAEQDGGLVGVRGRGLSDFQTEEGGGTGKGGEVILACQRKSVVAHGHGAGNKTSGETSLPRAAR